MSTAANTLETKSTDLGFTNLPMATATRAHGMRAGGRASEHTHFGTVKQDLVSGTMAL